MWNIQFFLNSALLGVGLGMDAFSVAIANGLNQKEKGLKEAFVIATVFAFCQGIMPLLGWIIVKSAVKRFEFLTNFVPIIAFFLLLFIGVKYLIDGFKKKQNKAVSLSFITILLQGIATSIDALSLGFTNASFTLPFSLLASLIISVITFAMCFVGVLLGKALYKEFSLYANIFGGVILIFVAIQILVKLFLLN